MNLLPTANPQTLAVNSRLTSESVGRLNCCWSSPTQSFLPWLQSPRDPWTRIVFSHRHIHVSKWALLFAEGRVDLSMLALRLLHRSFSTSISALSRRPGQYGLCAPFVTPLYKARFIQHTERFSFSVGLCSRLCLNLCNYFETAKFKPLILPMPGFSWSSTKYIWIYVV
jgi:hypothetical protein